MPRRRGLTALPGYAWDASLHNYVDLSTGTMVKRAAIEDLLVRVTDSAGDTMATLARAAQRGEITSRQFYELSHRMVKHSYNANVSLASGGWHRVTQAEWGRNGGLLRQEYGRLSEFARQIRDGELSEAQAGARARLYADSAYKRYWQIETGNEIARGNKEERWRTLGDEKVCPICLEIEGRGWQIIGTLPNPGDPHPGCRCAKEYR